MRISTPQIFNSNLATMQRAQSKLNQTNLQLSSGRTFLTPADDPNAAAQTVQLDVAIKTTEQYQRNNDLVRPQLEQEETQIEASQNILQRVRELVVAGSNDTYIYENRSIMAREIRELREDLIGIANFKEANGEYLFAGTRSHTEPFIVSDTGVVSYVGAAGAGSVRTIDITNNRQIRGGDTGEAVFMAIPERSGLLTEAVPKATNTGTMEVASVASANLEDALNSADQTLRIKFSYPATHPGAVEYNVLDMDGHAVRDNNGALISGTYGSTDAGGVFMPPTPANQPIEFAGRQITIEGAPANGDEVISRPVTQVSIFQTLEDIASAFEQSLSPEKDREMLSKASSIALRNVDSGLAQFSEIRTTVGVRLATLDTQTELNAERILDLSNTRSEVRDLDYAEAISRFKLQEVVLEAAQKTYIEMNKMSLFDLL
ncbi:flagellar hook-associated protein 3 [Chromatium okenii]|uniref:flagellar hook-associated protein FlgL n=1 Tax=Chromatium okenii TaxID=61644 RepID=UPI001908C59E|nr:flagellar hook-associated protein FlgL [Chromatium okenii]MBK1641065.1 flagellar hook-associated protein 3 [Chromatium okenii]